MLSWLRDGQFVRSRLCMQAFAIANSDTYSHADAEPDVAGADFSWCHSCADVYAHSCPVVHAHSCPDVHAHPCSDLGAYPRSDLDPVPCSELDSHTGADLHVCILHAAVSRAYCALVGMHAWACMVTHVLGLVGTSTRAQAWGPCN